MLALRLLGLGLLFASGAAKLGDVTQAFPTPMATLPVGQLWAHNHPGSLERAAEMVHKLGDAWIWEAGFRSLLEVQVWSLGAVLGLVLCLIGRRRRAPAGAARAATGPDGGAPHPPGRAQTSELASALASCRGALVGVALFSGLSNILMLTGAFFMLEIYDRVLPSRSLPTLIGLALLAGGLFVVQGLLDLLRARILVRVGGALDEAMSPRLYETIVQLPLRAAANGDGLQALRDLDSVRSFFAGAGLIALFDLPWMPIYLAVVFAFHPLLGVTALTGAVLLVLLTLLTEASTRTPTRAATVFATKRGQLAESSRRNAEVLKAMGMTGRFLVQWKQINREYMAGQRQASDIAAGIGSVSKVLRLTLQSGMLAIGAYLVLRQEATGGIIIAGSIIAARALAPVDLAIANWRVFVAARQGWQRLSKLLLLLPAQQPLTALKPPQTSLAVENASVTPPGDTKLVVQDASFALKSGQGLGIIGPSASGKSSLVRLLVGVWLPVRGKIRLDGAALDQWLPEAIGQHVGYLPQDVELFEGTVAQNIARFDPDARDAAITAAAEAAGVHGLIVALPQGYDTEIGEHGSSLSAGQRQRIALARALYRDPFLVVLDEPNSNLDSDGERALTSAILGVRKRGGIIVVVAHQPSTHAGVDLLLVMNQGRVHAFGPKEEVIAQLRRASAPSVVPLKVVPETERPAP